jgi:hypothetical protein
MKCNCVPGLVEIEQTDVTNTSVPGHLSSKTRYMFIGAEDTRMSQRALQGKLANTVYAQYTFPQVLRLPREQQTTNSVV